MRPPSHKRRGSALVITLLVITVISVLLTGLFQRVLGQRLGAAAENSVAAVVRTANDYTIAARIDLWPFAAIPGSTTLPATPSFTPSINSPWEADPSTPFSWGIPATATFAASPAYSTETWTPPGSLLRYAPFARLISYRPRLGLKTTFSGTAIQRSVELDIPIYETPTLSFEFVATDQPLDLGTSSRLLVNGIGLLPKGSTGSNSAGSAFTGGLLVPGNSPSTIERLPTGTSESLSWGGDTVELLSLNPASTASTAQSYAKVPGVIVISYPTAGAVPPGGDFAAVDFEGQTYLLIDLDSYSGSTHVFIDASGSGASVGAMVLGSPEGDDLAPVVLAGTCRFTLVGSNKRPMSLISNQQTLTVYSHLRDGLPASAEAAIETGWRGYIHLTTIDPVVATPQGWTDVAFTLFGSFACKGGIFRISPGVPGSPLDAWRIERSEALKEAMLPTAIHKDRIVVCP